MSYVEGSTRSGIAGAAIAVGARVKWNTSNKVVVAGVEQEDGVAITPSFADGDPITVKLCNAPGTVEMILSGTCAAMATLYGTTSGLVCENTSGQLLGKGMNPAAGVDTQKIEVLRK